MTTTSERFDPTAHLRQLNGKQYLEVVHRIQWLRAEAPDATITTKLEHVDFEAGWAIFHARVEIPGKGIAEGTGSETRAAFPAGWLEKAETIAVGRALAMLGYGTAFALADFEEGHPADNPVERREPIPIRNGAALSPRLGMLRSLLRGRHMTEEQLASEAGDRFGVGTPEDLSSAQVEQLIDWLKLKREAGRG